MTRVLVKPHVNTEIFDRSLRLAFLYPCTEGKGTYIKQNPFLFKANHNYMFLLLLQVVHNCGLFSLHNLVQPEDGLMPAETCSCNKVFNKQCRG